MLDKHKRSYSDYNCSLSFTDEDELVYGKMLKDKLFEELNLNELNYKEYVHAPFDDFIWFEGAEPHTGRMFDIDIDELYREASGVGLAVHMYECFQNEQGFWNTDLTKELSFKVEIQS